MGNFYTQVWAADTERDACEDLMKQLGRRCLVGPSHRGHTPVFDAKSEEQDIDILDSLALTLSHELKTWAVALLNHDDDYLAFRIFANGEEQGSLVSSTFGTKGLRAAGQLRRAISPRASLALLALHLFRPSIFQIGRHASIARTLSLPSWSVGAGYNYVLDGDLVEHPGLDQFTKL